MDLFVKSRNNPPFRLYILFIDEAHLVFQDASNSLLQQIETIVKLIRSKGIGIFFITQNPMDIPDGVLGQLGMKIQHALRAFTAADRKVIKQTAENYPDSTFYKTDELITQMGIGEAMVTFLNEKGIPTPLAHVLLCTPRSRLDVLTDQEIDTLASKSKLITKYNQTIDSESAYEILNAKLAEAAEKSSPASSSTSSASSTKPVKSTLEQVLDNSIVKQVGRTAASIITRSLLGAPGLGGRSRRY